jgi:hypothetical protein
VKPASSESAYWDPRFNYVVHPPTALICGPAWVLSTQTRLIQAHGELLRDKEVNLVFHRVQIMQRYEPLSFGASPLPS